VRLKFALRRPTGKPPTSVPVRFGDTVASVLRKLTIKGFKAIRQTTLELPPFTLFIGRNGAGKSSVLEALQWLQEGLVGGLTSATTVRFGSFTDLVNRRCADITLDLKFARSGRATPVHYELIVREGAGPAAGRPIVHSERCVVDRTAAARTVLWSRAQSGGRELRGPPYRWIRHAQGRPKVVRSGDEVALRETRGIPGAGDLAEYLERAVILRLSPTSLATSTPDHPRVSGPALAEDGRDLPLLIAQLAPAARRRLVQRVATVFPSVEDVDVEEVGHNKFIVVGERMRARGGTSRFSIPSWLLSEGTRRILAIFALLESTPRPSLIAIEEIENGLDPWTLTLVMDALRAATDEGTQLMVTTHSPFLLDHVDVQEIVHVRRDAGESTYEPVREIASVANYEGVLAPGAMYLARIFGAEGTATDADTAE